MKDEYAVSGAERGRSSRPDAVLTPPVPLDPDVLRVLATRADARGISLDDLVNAMSKEDIGAIEAVG